jgi:hypothetical protein
MHFKELLESFRWCMHGFLNHSKEKKKTLRKIKFESKKYYFSFSLT